MIKFIFTVILISVYSFIYAGQSELSENKSIPLPVYVSALPNINDYNLFSNGGWDGNWYIGYNTCWIKKLSGIPKGNYRKAFIGAKIGRAKTEPKPGRPIWEKEHIKGDIYIGISSTPAWRSDQRYYLVSNEDIPLEGDWENAVEGVGESRWFWCEVPVNSINFEGANYIAIWSPSEYFISNASAPILCGGWGTKTEEITTWLNDEIQGTPPIQPEISLKTQITVFEPALAIKLIPENTEQELKVKITGICDGKKGTLSKVVFVLIDGIEIERAWIEAISASELETDNRWKKITSYLYNPPYIFTIYPLKMEFPEGKIYIRAVCEDIWSNIGYSAPEEMLIENQTNISPEKTKSAGP